MQGRCAKASAVYEELAREIAIVYGEFIKTDRLRAADESQGHAGLESPISNDLISAKPWVLEKSLDMEAS